MTIERFKLYDERLKLEISIQSYCLVGKVLGFLQAFYCCGAIAVGFPLFNQCQMYCSSLLRTIAIGDCDISTSILFPAIGGIHSIPIIHLVPGILHH